MNASRTDALLCGDIGGTHARLALVRPGAPDAPIFQRVFPSRDHAGFLPLLDAFLAEADAAGYRGKRALRLRGAAFGIPGPVASSGDTLWMVNLPWRFRASAVARALGLRKVRFLNDFEAVALAVPQMPRRHLKPVGRGKADPGKPIVVMGAGTGLGVAFLIPSGKGYAPVSTETDATGFAPRNALEVRLLEYVLQRLGSTHWELVLSGPGLVHLYEFLRDREGVPETAVVRTEMAQGDPSSVIAAHGQAIGPRDPLCAQAVDLFCTLYGALAGNLALTVMATGGVYLAGGIAPKLLGPLQQGGFRAAFAAKHAFGHTLAKIPVYVITHPNPGLLGAALAAEAEWQS